MKKKLSRSIRHNLSRMNCIHLWVINFHPFENFWLKRFWSMKCIHIWFINFHLLNNFWPNVFLSMKCIHIWFVYLHLFKNLAVYCCHFHNYVLYYTLVKTNQNSSLGCLLFPFQQLCTLYNCNVSEKRIEHVRWYHMVTIQAKNNTRKQKLYCIT